MLTEVKVKDFLCILVLTMSAAVVIAALEFWFWFWFHSCFDYCACLLPAYYRWFFGYYSGRGFGFGFGYRLCDSGAPAAAAAGSVDQCNKTWSTMTTQTSYKVSFSGFCQECTACWRMTRNLMKMM